MHGGIRASVSVIMHATEDAGRFLGALEGVLGIRREEFAARELEGHHGNPITLLEAELAGDDASRLAGRIAAAMPAAELDGVVADLHLTVSGSGLHLRFGKQDLAGGRLAVAYGDAVKVRIRAPSGGAAPAYAALLGRPSNR